MKATTIYYATIYGEEVSRRGIPHFTAYSDLGLAYTSVRHTLASLGHPNPSETVSDNRLDFYRDYTLLAEIRVSFDKVRETEKPKARRAPKPNCPACHGTGWDGEGYTLTCQTCGSKKP